MIPYLRRKKILEALEVKELIYLDEFAPLLEDTSPSTIRRDLKLLEEEGRIEVLQGGAARLLTTSLYDMPLNSKQQVHTAEKDIIARYAADLVKDGEVIYLDSGTTTLTMVKYLKSKEIEVITSNTMVLSQLEESQFTCHILGGEIEKSLGSVAGAVTDNLLREMYFDKSFIGCTGVDVSYGITTPDFREANKKRIAMEHSAHTYVLADGDKLGKRALCRAFGAEKCTLITDSLKPEFEDIPHYFIAS